MGHQDEGGLPLGREPPQLPQRRPGLADVVARDDQLFGGRSWRRFEDAAAALDAAGGRVQHPGEVRRVRGDDLLSFAGEGAAVDHGEPVGLARVSDELAERVAVAAR